MRSQWFFMLDIEVPLCSFFRRPPEETAYPLGEILLLDPRFQELPSLSYCRDLMPSGVLAGGPRTLQCMQDTPPSLLLKNLLDLADLFLNFAGHLFIGTLGFQLWIID